MRVTRTVMRGVRVYMCSVMVGSTYLFCSMIYRFIDDDGSFSESEKKIEIEWIVSMTYLIILNKI